MGEIIFYTGLGVFVIGGIGVFISVICWSINKTKLAKMITQGYWTYLKRDKNNLNEYKRIKPLLEGMIERREINIAKDGFPENFVIDLTAFNRVCMDNIEKISEIIKESKNEK